MLPEREKGITMLVITIATQCPHCGTHTETSILSSEDAEGDFVQKCPNCYQMFAVIWALHVEATVFQCAKKPAEESFLHGSVTDDNDSDDSDDVTPEQVES